VDSSNEWTPDGDCDGNPDRSQCDGVSSALHQCRNGSGLRQQARRQGTTLPMTAHWSASSSCSEIAASDAEICPPRRAYLGRNRDTHDEPNEGLECFHTRRWSR
jgi:hypothetical protein